MIRRLYSDFDAPITIRAAQRKTFFENEINFTQITNTPGVKNYSKATEETVVLKHEEKWANAQMIGVETSFLAMSDMQKHLVDGIAGLYENNIPVGIIGATLLDNLNGYIPQTNGHESLIIYAPKRNLKLSTGKNPFYSQRVSIVGRMNFNREINAQTLVVPLELSQELLGFSEHEFTALYIDINETHQKNEVKQALQKQLGEDFIVKTNDEKHELIFKTAQTERLLVVIILGFIFILASFTLIASLNMLFIEKKQDIHILKSMGGNQPFLFRIFFYEGLLVAIRGICIGLILGYGICFVQLQFNWIEMPNSHGEMFPIALKFSDLLIILALLGTISLLSNYFPVKMLLKQERNKGKS